MQPKRLPLAKLHSLWRRCVAPTTDLKAEFAPPLIEAGRAAEALSEPCRGLAVFASTNLAEQSGFITPWVPSSQQRNKYPG